ncbi:MAG: succinate dehydrogenase, hydrophobic membrane anchor protein [Alphaproteobacteria bacterium]|nr:succinate dehydrogenase, hydrophobic membrane anchor protein [Alphaproteobacteria bacterium SS10]
MSDFSSPLRNARGLGSAKDGTHHWWVQRVSAVAMVLLVLWFIGLVVSFGGTDYAYMVETMSQPINAILMLLLISAAFFHASLGLQVVLEDYVSHEWPRKLSIIAVKLICIAGAVACYFSVLKIALA